MLFTVLRFLHIVVGIVFLGRRGQTVRWSLDDEDRLLEDHAWFRFVDRVGGFLDIWH